MYLLSMIVVGISVKKDIQQRKINIYLIIAGVICALFVRLFILQDIKSGIYGSCIGILILLTAKFTNQSVGYGDAAMIFFVGICLGLQKCLTVCVICLFMMSMGSLILFALKKVRLKTAIPVMPWMFISLILGGLLW